MTTGEIGSDGEVKKFGTLAVVQASFREVQIVNHS